MFNWLIGVLVMVSQSWLPYSSAVVTPDINSTQEKQQTIERIDKTNIIDNEATPSATTQPTPNIVKVSGNNPTSDKTIEKIANPATQSLTILNECWQNQACNPTPTPKINKEEKPEPSTNPTISPSAKPIIPPRPTVVPGPSFAPEPNLPSKPTPTPISYPECHYSNVLIGPGARDREIVFCEDLGITPLQ